MPQRVNIKVAPRAKEDKIVGFKDGILRVRLVAPPVEGKANRALVEFLADAWGVPKLSIKIIQGETSREKLLEIPDSVSLQKALI